MLKGNDQTAMRPPVLDTPPKYEPAPHIDIKLEQEPKKSYVAPDGNIKPVENTGDKYVPAPTDEHGNIGSLQEERPNDTPR